MDMQDILILGIENPLLDLSTQGKEEFYKKYNLPLNTTVLATKEHLQLFEEMKHEKFNFIPGGSVQNTVRGCAWLFGQKYENKTAYIGSIGKDDYGKMLIEAMNKAKVKTYYHIHPTEITGICGVLIQGTNRLCLPWLGAATLYPTSHIKENWEVFKKSKIVYSSGYFITTNFEALMLLAKGCLDEKKYFVFNFGAAFWLKNHVDKFKEVITYSNYIICNDEEAFTVGEHYGYDISDKKDLLQIALGIAKLPMPNPNLHRTMIVTNGAKSTIVAFYDGKDYVVKEIPVKKVPKEKIVDTNGAGDSFAAGFMCGLALDKNLFDCIELGHYLASEVIQMEGCTFPPVPKINL